MNAPRHLAWTILESLRRAPGDLTYEFVRVGQPTRVVDAAGMRGLIERHARGFAGLALRPGTVVPLAGPTSAALWAAFVGAIAAGLVPCMMPEPTFKTHLPTWARNLAALLDRYRSRTLVAPAASREPLEQALHACARELALIDLEALDDPSPSPLPPAEEGRGIAFLQHSSGSTGIPKGVALTHAAVLDHLDAYARAIALDARTDRIASWLPLYHDMGLVTSLLLPLVHGVATVSIPPAEWILDPTAILCVIAARRATLAWWPNFTYPLLAARVREPDLARLDLSSLRMLVNCSEPVLGCSHGAFRERFARCGLRQDALHASYAMAENVFAVTQSSGACPRRTSRGLAASSGRPLPGVTLTIVDGERRAVPVGGTGEIALASPWLFDRYLELPEQTARVRDGALYYTGDLGFIEDGELFVLGRKTDLIVVGGRKLLPDDIERAALSVQGVKEGRAVAFGVLDAGRGTQDVVVLVESVHHADSAQVQRIKKEIRAAVLRQADCVVDRTCVVAPQTLVKTSSGKLARADNRRLFEQGLFSRGDGTA